MRFETEKCSEFVTESVVRDLEISVDMFYLSSRFRRIVPGLSWKLSVKAVLSKVTVGNLFLIFYGKQFINQFKCYTQTIISYVFQFLNIIFLKYLKHWILRSAD